MFEKTGRAERAKREGKERENRKSISQESGRMKIEGWCGWDLEAGEEVPFRGDWERAPGSDADGHCRMSIDERDLRCWEEKGALRGEQKKTLRWHSFHLKLLLVLTSIVLFLLNLRDSSWTNTYFCNCLTFLTLTFATLQGNTQNSHAGQVKTLKYTLL